MCNHDWKICLFVSLDCCKISSRERECQTGFLVVRGECIDFDECKKHNGFRYENLHCRITVGSYSCGCRNGFKLITRINWDLYINEPECVDIDECKNVRLPKVSVMKRLCVGTSREVVKCNCQEGYFGDGQICFPGSCTDINCPLSDLKECVLTRSNLWKCREGYEIDNSSVCVDVDECQKGLCDQNADCVKFTLWISGNFSCSCSFSYDGDGISWTPIPTVLVLNTKDEHKTPLLVNGKGQSNVVMPFVNGTEVYLSCSVSICNRFYVFGGENKERQISEVTQCELRRIGTLDFHYENKKQCRSAVDPLGSFTEIAPSTYYHFNPRW